MQPGHTPATVLNAWMTGRIALAISCPSLRIEIVAVPPPLPKQYQHQSSFAADLERIETLAWTPVRRAGDLARNLDEIYQLAANAKFTNYDIDAVGRAAPEIMYRLFDIRVHLRKRIAEFRRANLMTDEVVIALRNVFRVLRYVSDMLGEIAGSNARLAPGEYTYRGFTGPSLNTLANYDMFQRGEVEFRSGDVILVRGRQHNSAAIARIGTADSQFSHVGVVYIDEQGEHWLVESLIEDGAVITPLSAALDHGLARAALYRHYNERLAERAAKAIHYHVSQSLGQGPRIAYDFSMRLDDEAELFCSKLVRLAYAMASGGRYMLPAYPTRIEMRNADFLNRVGVKTNMTFAPYDIDLEPEFDLVAEWQDYRETSAVRLQDFAMDKLFEWMELYGYRFDETPMIRLISRLGRFASYFSEDAKRALSSVFPRVPRNMPRKTVAVVAMLHKTAEPICAELREIERRSIAKTGLPLHGLEIFAHLERIRQREGGRLGYLTAPLMLPPPSASANGDAVSAYER